MVFLQKSSIQHTFRHFVKNAEPLFNTTLQIFLFSFLRELCIIRMVWRLSKKKVALDMFLILAGGLLIIILAVIVAVVSSVVSAVAADQDIESE